MSDGVTLVLGAAAGAIVSYLLWDMAGPILASVAALVAGLTIGIFCATRPSGDAGDHLDPIG